VHLGSDGLMAAGGYYMMAPDQVARFRAAVDDDRRGDDLVKRLAAVEAEGVTIAGEQLRTRPRGVDPEHPRLDLMRRKGLYGHRGWPPDDVLHERLRSTAWWRRGAWCARSSSGWTTTSAPPSNTAGDQRADRSRTRAMLGRVSRRTKIVCTIGPATATPDRIRELVQAAWTSHG
jgi:hypothetical protein